MSEQDYLKALEENPLLPRRPDLITDSSQNTRDSYFNETDLSVKIINPKIRTEIRLSDCRAAWSRQDMNRYTLMHTLESIF
jgi:hypothetical protein